jgi:crotonobetainyl-CoA:carnitine CoA-transferase CaiB-like acyl-CoA transferase
MKPPLQGIRILDMTHSWAGPHATRMLADFGAEVIRVEYVRRLCLLRGGLVENKAYDHLPGWLQVNRNKRSITLDLNNEADCRILRLLVATADVFAENGRPGVIDKLGFGYTHLREIKSDIIMVSMSAFGQTGPYAPYAGYGATMEALSGIQTLTAYATDEKPVRIKELDIINGCAAAGAIITALLHRQSSGQGQHIDLSQMEAATHALIGDHLLAYGMNRSVRLPVGNRHPQLAPQGCYPCKAPDTWLTVTVRSEEEWHRFCQALGEPELETDHRFASLSERMRHHNELDGRIAKWTMAHTDIEAMQILQGCGIPAGPAFNAAQLFENDHLRARGYFVTDAVGSEKPFMGLPFKLSKSGACRIRRGPQLGEHNREITDRFAGQSEDTIRPFNEDAIGTAYDPE